MAGHRTADCPLSYANPAVHAAKVEAEHMTDRVDAFATDSERVQEYKEAEERFGPCKLCGTLHTYNRRVAGEEVTWPSGRFSSCPTFMDMSPQEKAKVIEEKKGCPRCLSWGHQKRTCQRSGRPCKEIVDGKRCKRGHDTSLHASGNKYCEAAMVVEQVQTAQAGELRILLAVQDVPVRHEDTLINA